MGQMGFFDVSKRYAGLDAKSDPLVKLNAIVPWAYFRPQLEAVWRRPPEARKSKAGRKPWDVVVMFKALVLCELYNLSDEQFEYQVRDRLSFTRFLGLGLEDPVPDATTVWQYREQLVQAGVVDELFGAFDGYLEAQGWLAMGGQMIDASIVPVPKQRNDRDENAAIRAGVPIIERTAGDADHRQRPFHRQMRGFDRADDFQLVGGGVSHVSSPQPLSCFFSTAGFPMSVRMASMNQKYPFPQTLNSARQALTPHTGAGPRRRY